jgi:hypothetical protein
MCETWGRVRMRIGIILMLIRILILNLDGISMEIRFRVGIKLMPIHNIGILVCHSLEPKRQLFVH